jgi:hypothetical protein
MADDLGNSQTLLKGIVQQENGEHLFLLWKLCIYCMFEYKPILHPHLHAHNHKGWACTGSKFQV